MKISNKKELDEAILELEKLKVTQYNLLISQYRETAESLKPGNLIRSSVQSIVHSPQARAGIIKTVAGFAIGMLTKKLFFKKSGSFAKKLIGNALKMGVAKTAISNTDKIKAYGTAIYHNLFKGRT